MNKIFDQFTDLPITRQRKHQLRNPEKVALQVKRYQQSKRGRKVTQKSALKYYYKNKELCIERVRSYQARKQKTLLNTGA